MAAVDNARLTEALPRARLLFAAHRKELLKQSLATFRHALRDGSFGELWVDGQRPSRWEHVFASIQPLSRSNLEQLSTGHFDMLIIDEFHRAAANSYTKVLKYLQPAELLGLTATPERADGLSVHDWFDGRIAAEMRLWDAIDQHRLVPFNYYGIHDNTDLMQVPWKRGRGYDVEGLTNVFTANDALARLIITQMQDRVSSLATMRALGICVSIAHARYMARVFSESGIAALAVWSDTPRSERSSALTELAKGNIQMLFSVDLFNEGVDIPTVDTLLMLRPTESGTLFLQQLGRGLRMHPNKSVCTILDFVDQHRKEFRYDKRFKALLGGTRKSISQQITDGFPFLPAGCHMELDKKSSDIVLQSIKQSLPSTLKAIVQELKSVAADMQDSSISLGHFLIESGLDLNNVYSANRCWSQLLELAELPVLTPGPNEKVLRRGIGRLLHIGDELRISFYRNCLAQADQLNLNDLTVGQKRLIRMLVSNLSSQIVSTDTSLADGWQIIVKHPQIRCEISELLAALKTKINHTQHELTSHPSIPLMVHASYKRTEIVSAFGIGTEDSAKSQPWREGVFWVPEIPADIFAFTLDKTNGQFSPTTRYKDYAINRNLIHWESQSMTRADSQTGQRCQQHEARGSSVMLFGRERSDSKAFLFLGPAKYVSHKSERPMAITWELDTPLPGDIFALYAAAVS